MSELVVSPAAERDLDSILSYLVGKLCNPQAAGNLLDEVDAAYDTLQNEPEAFELCCDSRLRDLGYRKVTVGSYLLIYEYDLDLDAVNVLRFFHESQNYCRMM